MRKEVLWGIGLAVGVAAIVTGLFLLPGEDGQETMPEETVAEELPLFQEPIGVEPQYPDDYDFDKDDNKGEVTQIIIDLGDSDPDEISNILSEKVIIDDEVVDKTKSPE